MTKEFYKWIFDTSPERWGKINKIRGQDAFILNFLEDYKNKKIRILDLGCGNGKTLNIIYRKNWELYGIDYIPKAIEIAKKALKDKAVLKVRDIYDTKFPDKSFDIIYSIGVYEHSLTPRFNEVHRILKDDGTFICHVPIAKDKEERKITNFYSKKGANPGKHFEWFLSEEKWTSKLNQAKFKVKIPKKTYFVCTKDKV